jgi:3-dehydroquinate synthase
MVDAAIGGKVGANLLGTKNAVGAFHPPRAVLAGTDWLRSLPPRARRSGLGEVVKYAMIADRRLFLQLERGAQEVLARRPAADARLVARCCRIKARFVGTDPRDQGIRAALNFGHTLGHALEGDGKSGLEHGEAVGLGMLAACALAEDLGVAREPMYERLRRVLLQLGLPVRLRARPDTGVLRRRWRRDKKVRQGTVRVVLTPRIGEVTVGVRVEEQALERALARILPPRRRAGSAGSAR